MDAGTRERVAQAIFEVNLVISQSKGYGIGVDWETLTEEQRDAYRLFADAAADTLGVV